MKNSDGVAIPLSANELKIRYIKQNNSGRLKPGQNRRVKKKQNQARGHKES